MLRDRPLVKPEPDSGECRGAPLQYSQRDPRSREGVADETGWLAETPQKIPAGTRARTALLVRQSQQWGVLPCTDGQRTTDPQADPGARERRRAQARDRSAPIP